MEFLGSKSRILIAVRDLLNAPFFLDHALSHFLFKHTIAEAYSESSRSSKTVLFAKMAAFSR